MNKQRLFQTSILHPYLTATYPVIALLAHNIEEIKVGVALRAFLSSILAALLVILFFKAVFKQGDKAAWMTTFVLIFFYSYGHVYNFLGQSVPGGAILGRHRLLAPLWLAVLVGVIWWINRTQAPLQRWNQALNLVATAALVIPVAQIALFGLRTLYSSTPLDEERAIADIKLPQGAPTPDVYYIILDAYTRDDILQESFGLDNAPFLEQLEAMGFYVARCSQSNYAQTQLSLASSLNMDYLQALNPNYTPEQQTRVGLEEIIRHSTTRRALESLGYRVVAFETGFKGTQWEDADLYLTPASGLLHSMQIEGGLNGFEVLLLRNSAGLIVADGATILPRFFQPDFDNPRKTHRELVLYALEQLSALPNTPGPKFVFAHLVIPHPPYVFDATGEFPPSAKEDIPGYRDQVRYINQRLLEIIPILLSQSATPPIIILQGDHGPIGGKANERMKILNAYHLPGTNRVELPQDISPVNTFRVVFDQYFGGDFELLDNISYHSVYYEPFDFSIVVDDRPGCSP